MVELIADRIGESVFALINCNHVYRVQEVGNSTVLVKKPRNDTCSISHVVVIRLPAALGQEQRLVPFIAHLYPSGSAAKLRVSLSGTVAA